MSPVPTLPPVPSVQQYTRGRASWRFVLSGLEPRPRLDANGKPLPGAALLDYYAGVTACWDPEDLHSPCVELSVRGYDAEPCMVAPCGSKTEGADRRPVGPHPMGLVLRESGDIAKDGTGIPEHDMCGQGILYPHRLPLGAWPVVDVTLEWSPEVGWKVSTPAAVRTLKQGAPRVGLGWQASGVGKPPRGIGWAREPWTVQAHGGTVELLRWEAVGAQGVLGACP